MQCRTGSLVLAPIKVYGLRYIFAKYTLPGGRPPAISVVPPVPKTRRGVWGGGAAPPVGSGFGFGIGFGMRFRVWDKSLGWGWGGLGFGFGCHEGIEGWDWDWVQGLDNVISTFLVIYR